MADGSLPIAGPNTLTQIQIRRWWGSRGNARINGTIDQLIAAYLSEGHDQGIRGDVAFAQAVKETGYFTNNDTKRNNYAGIGHYNNAPAGFDFSDLEIGVRAQIQLLYKIVNGNDALLVYPNVAPRWAGPRASTWSGLDGHWAVPGVGYGNSVVSLWSSIAAGTTPAAGTSPTPPVSIPPAFPPPPASTLPTIRDDWKASATIDNLQLWNGSLDADGTSRFVIGGDVDLAHDRLSQFTFVCVDPDLSISGRFGSELGQVAAFGLTRIPMTAAAVGVASGQGGPETTVTLRASISEWLARDKGPLTESNVSATDFISHRVSDYNTLFATGANDRKGGYVGQPTASRGVVQRTAPLGKPSQYESSWDLGKRLAAEEGFLLYESAGAIWFGKPSWLAGQGTRFDVGWGPLADKARPHVMSIDVPACYRSREVTTGDTCTVTLPHDIGEQVRVGMVFTLSGVYGFNRDYLVVRVRWRHDGMATPVEVTGWQVVDPEPSGTGAPAPTPDLAATAPTPALVWPFGTKAVGQYQRVDQGWDLQGPPGGDIRAVAAGVVGLANRDPGGFGNDYPYVVLDQPFPGAPSDTIYYGHVHVDPVLVGHHVATGQVIARANLSNPQNGSAAPAGWLEIGFARHATGVPAVRAGEGTATAAGHFMHDLLINAPTV